MGKVTILPYTTKDPISLIGRCAGICWGSDITDAEKNYKRGLDCIKSNHGRTFEFVDIYACIDGYSARVIREWYTHIGGSPTRLQASTRYIDYGEFGYVMPIGIEPNSKASAIYEIAMEDIADNYRDLLECGVLREDAAMILPLGMTTKITDKRNLRNVMDMSRQRMCNRAYWEYRMLFADYCHALSEYSEEWHTVIHMLMHPKCGDLGYCPEKKSCGMYKGKEE